nr:hypothetical protein Iba_scaffold29754CG0040 [Ipomoea batatas]
MYSNFVQNIKSAPPCKFSLSAKSSHLSRTSLFGSISGRLNLNLNLMPKFLEKNFSISSIRLTGNERYNTTVHSAQLSGVTEKRTDNGCTYRMST